jgi:Protein of unknown function (DUF4244)
VLDRILRTFIGVFHHELLDDPFGFPSGAPFDQSGQSTAEYALVIVAAAAIVGLLLSWITKSNGIGSIFNGVIGKVLKFIT